MKRTLLGVTALVGLAIPLVVATVFLFGCCVLPFHKVVHTLMPLCSIAAQLAHGGERESASTPAQARDEAVRQFPSELTSAFRTSLPSGSQSFSPSTHHSYRSFITLGATRCDRDVGRHLALLDTFRI